VLLGSLQAGHRHCSVSSSEGRGSVQELMQDVRTSCRTTAHRHVGVSACRAALGLACASRSRTCTPRLVERRGTWFRLSIRWSAFLGLRGAQVSIVLGATVRGQDCLMRGAVLILLCTTAIHADLKWHSAAPSGGSACSVVICAHGEFGEHAHSGFVALQTGCASDSFFSEIRLEPGDTTWPPRLRPHPGAVPGGASTPLPAAQFPKCLCLFMPHISPQNTL
jgi:hypothetical protein